MIAIDLSHSSHTRARTGIQRVSRSLHAAMADQRADEVCGITWDPFREVWRRLLPFEAAGLSAEAPGIDRRARWPLHWRVRGRIERWARRPDPSFPAPTAVIVPEIFSPQVAARLPLLLARATGPRIALFHDAIALKLPEFTPARTVARFPAYLRDLLLFDGIAAVSQDSHDTLLDWWRWAGVTEQPEVTTIPLGVDEPAADTVLARTTALPVVLAVATLEGRKNHLALLDACETLWQQGHAFELRLIGQSHPETGRKALARTHALQAAGRPLRYDGAVDEKTLRSAYHECAFTVYPSLMEGFGLPVLESLSYGKPCICSSRGALGESSRDGGCLSLPSVDSSSLASAIVWLLTKPEQRLLLAHAARSRARKSWKTYADELLAWMPGVRRRKTVAG